MDKSLVGASTALLSPDTPVQLYFEENLDGSRWRVMRVYRSKLTGGEVEVVRDLLGEESDFQAETFAIPSAGSDPTDWNTLGECMEIAADIHASGGLKKQRTVPPATGQQWAEELVNQNDFMRQWARGRSVYGPGGHTQRSKDWVR